MQQTHMNPFYLFNYSRMPLKTASTDVLYEIKQLTHKHKLHEYV